MGEVIRLSFESVAQRKKARESLQKFLSEHKGKGVEALTTVATIQIAHWQLKIVCNLEGKDSSRTKGYVKHIVDLNKKITEEGNNSRAYLWAYGDAMDLLYSE